MAAASRRRWPITALRVSFQPRRWEALLPVKTVARRNKVSTTSFRVVPGSLRVRTSPPRGQCPIAWQLRDQEIPQAADSWRIADPLIPPMPTSAPENSGRATTGRLARRLREGRWRCFPGRLSSKRQDLGEIRRWLSRALILHEPGGFHRGRRPRRAVGVVAAHLYRRRGRVER